MKLHGHTTIELTNVETGEKRTVEDDNMITNGLSKLIENVPGEDTPPLCRLLTKDTNDSVNTSLYGLSRSIMMLTGGLILFNSQLDEDPDNFLPQSGVSVTGCASTAYYAGTNIMAGSYNDAESGFIEGGGYKHVWDFNTTQCNGQIGCACLTTREGGFAGGGTFPYDYEYRLKTPSNGRPTFEDMLSWRRGAWLRLADSRGHQFGDSVLYADYNKGTVICFNDIEEFSGCVQQYISSNPSDWFQRSLLTNKMVTFDIKRFIIKDFSLFDYNLSGSTDGSRRTDNGYGTRVLNTVTVEMPQTLKDAVEAYLKTNGYFHVTHSSDEGFIYITIYKDMTTSERSEKINKDDIIHVWKINVNDFTSEHIKVTNRTGKVLKYSINGNNFGNQEVYVTNDCVLVIAKDDYSVYQINLNDSTDVTQIKLPDGSPLLVKTYGDMYNYFKLACSINKKVYFMLYNWNNTSGSNYVVIDTVLKNARYRNSIKEVEYYADNINFDPMHRVYVQGSKGFMLTENWNTSHIYSLVSLNVLPEILVTINNLPNTVLKTSAETMKVTYTLSLLQE